MAETIMSIVVTFICVLPLLAVGILQYHSKAPVGFWAGKKPPEPEQVTDVRAYNRRHGIMWIAYGAGFFLMFLTGLPFGGIAAAAASGLECFGGICLMIWYHSRLDRKYLKKTEVKGD